jgi:hypothetical protein
MPQHGPKFGLASNCSNLVIISSKSLFICYSSGLLTYFDEVNPLVGVFEPLGVLPVLFLPDLVLF